MTTAGLLELRKDGRRVFIYGIHDGYPEGWPSLAVRWLAERCGDVEAEEVLKRLRRWDFENHMKYDYETYHYKNWKETEREIRRIATIHFRLVGEDDVLSDNLEKGWDYWYVVDLDRGRAAVKKKKAVRCPPAEEGAVVICGEEVVEEFDGAIDEFLANYA